MLLWVDNHVFAEEAITHLMPVDWVNQSTHNLQPLFII